MRKRFHLVCVLAVLVLGAHSCQDFFSTSLTPWVARTSFTIPADISTTQALDYVAQALANNDPTLAASLTPILLTQAKAAVDDPLLYDQLASAMVTTVLLSSNVGTAFNQSLSAMAGGFEESEAGMEAAIQTIVGAFAAVSFSATDIAALQQLVDTPPATIPVLDVQAAAAGLLFQALNDTDFFDASAEPDLDALAENESYILALALVQLIPEGTETPLGSFLDMFSGFGE